MGGKGGMMSREMMPSFTGSSMMGGGGERGWVGKSGETGERETEETKEKVRGVGQKVESVYDQAKGVTDKVLGEAKGMADTMYSTAAQGLRGAAQGAREGLSKHGIPGDKLTASNVTSGA